MKCPKCSYTSFDYLDTCRKCGSDLRDARTILQIIAVSPEEKAPIFGDDAAPARAAGRATSTFEPSTSSYATELENEDDDLGGAAESDDTMLADLNFDKSFSDMVVPTSLSGASGKGESRETAEDDGLLDLDFGDVFGDKEKK